MRTTVPNISIPTIIHHCLQPFSSWDCFFILLNRKKRWRLKIASTSLVDLFVLSLQKSHAFFCLTLTIKKFKEAYWGKVMKGQSFWIYGMYKFKTIPFVPFVRVNGSSRLKKTNTKKTFQPPWELHLISSYVHCKNIFNLECLCTTPVRAVSNLISLAAISHIYRVVFTHIHSVAMVIQGGWLGKPIGWTHSSDMGVSTAKEVFHGARLEFNQWDRSTRETGAFQCSYASALFQFGLGLPQIMASGVLLMKVTLDIPSDPIPQPSKK